MLAEIYLLKLEAAVGPPRKRRLRLLPHSLCLSPYRLARRPKPAFHRTVAICPPAAKATPRIQNNSGLSQGPAGASGPT